MDGTRRVPAYVWEAPLTADEMDLPSSMPHVDALNDPAVDLADVGYRLA
jgi:hypothetical protein